MAHPIGTSPAFTPRGNINPADLPDPRRLSADVDPVAREMLERAARTIRLRADSTRTLLQWKTARRMRETSNRKAA